MNLQCAQTAKNEAQQVVVGFPGIPRYSSKCGVIVDIKQKLRSGRIRYYARVKWQTPTTRGDDESDVFLGRVQPVSRVLNQC